MSWQTAKQDAAKLAELYPASLAGEHITLSAYADGETYRQLSYQLAHEECMVNASQLTAVEVAFVRATYDCAFVEYTKQEQANTECQCGVCMEEYFVSVGQL